MSLRGLLGLAFVVVIGCSASGGGDDPPVDGGANDVPGGIDAPANPDAPASPDVASACSPPSCDDGVACTEDTCTAAGCTHSAVAARCAAGQ
ncbi:MAG: hypothetical protein JWM10_3955, partial [Myxococcaceae bacterium]|nr:hypothetical protein [Myxococcaceae bacterium]